MSNRLPNKKVKEKKKVEVAIPKIWEYREKFTNKGLTGRDVTAPPAQVDTRGYVDADMSQFGNLVVGDGLQIE